MNDLILKNNFNGYYWYWSKFCNEYFQSEINNLCVVNDRISSGSLLSHSEKEYDEIINSSNYIKNKLS